MLPFELIKDTPYLALSGELWSVFNEYLNRNWPCYKGFLLYAIFVDLRCLYELLHADGGYGWCIFKWIALIGLKFRLPRWIVVPVMAIMTTWSITLLEQWYWRSGKDMSDGAGPNAVGLWWSIWASVMWKTWPYFRSICTYGDGLWWHIRDRWTAHWILILKPRRAEFIGAQIRKLTFLKFLDTVTLCEVLFRLLPRKGIDEWLRHISDRGRNSLAFVIISVSPF